MKKQTFIKDLKQAKKNIGYINPFICANLELDDSTSNQWQKIEYWQGTISWWGWDYEQVSYVIEEKKRFLTDLIQKVKEMTKEEWESILGILKEK